MQLTFQIQPHLKGKIPEKLTLLIKLRQYYPADKNTFVVYTCRFLHERKDSAPNRKGLILDKDILDCQTNVITTRRRTGNGRIKGKLKER